MDFLAVEKKWSEKWKQDKADSFGGDMSNKKYVLEMFSYPSAANLHLGHWYNYGLTDIYARYSKMKGSDVFHPMGFDAFGLPAENYAIKTGVHPKDSTEKNIELMEHQLKAMGASFDWDYEIKTCNPDYYKWTQWLFLELYKHGLCEQKNALVNWCDSCNTVIANEQVVDGKCERCKTEIKRKNLKQWSFKITKYAEELLSELDNLDWPEKTKAMQRNWIGKSVGGEVEFDIVGGGSFKVFTTRPDTLYGCTYVVMAPEHELVPQITTAERMDEVLEYKRSAAMLSEIDRTSTVKEKTGCFTGAYCINPINGRKVPIWVSDYVIATYGTGVVMAVPAHDDRDFEFATKFGHGIERVVSGAQGKDDLPFTQYGVSCNSGELDGIATKDMKSAVLAKLNDMGKGGECITYRLRDWYVSRQRYWGAPIPMIHCDKCGAVPVPEKDLPVELPYDVNFTPDGKSPLQKHDGFMNVACPKCGAPAKRDADTLDTFVCSSWYFLRYPNANSDDKPFDSSTVNQLLPVDVYVGGAEHACMHLLYARFITKALRDMGHINFGEPFKRLIHQGVILGTDGIRMSKSRGNIINPDSFVKDYGSDVFKMYLSFAFSYTEGGPFSENGIPSIAKFLDRAERILLKAVEGKGVAVASGEKAQELEYAVAYAAQRCNIDIESFSFNTAVARIMELTNSMSKYGDADNLLYESAKTYVKLVAPIVPHFAEEMWEKLGGTSSVLKESYPVCDESKLVVNKLEYAVQINGKMRTKLSVSAELDVETVKQVALSDEKVVAGIGDKEIARVIVVPKKLVNIVLAK